MDDTRVYDRASGTVNTERSSILVSYAKGPLAVVREFFNRSSGRRTANVHHRPVADKTRAPRVSTGNESNGREAGTNATSPYVFGVVLPRDGTTPADKFCISSLTNTTLGRTPRLVFGVCTTVVVSRSRTTPARSRTKNIPPRNNNIVLFSYDVRTHIYIYIPLLRGGKTYIARVHSQRKRRNEYSYAVN